MLHEKIFERVGKDGFFNRALLSRVALLCC